MFAKTNETVGIGSKDEASKRRDPTTSTSRRCSCRKSAPKIGIKTSARKTSNLWLYQHSEDPWFEFEVEFDKTTDWLWKL